MKTYSIFLKSENRYTSSSISVNGSLKCGLSLIELVIFDIQFVRVIKSYVHAPFVAKIARNIIYSLDYKEDKRKRKLQEHFST